MYIGFRDFIGFGWVQDFFKLKYFAPLNSISRQFEVSVLFPH